VQPSRQHGRSEVVAIGDFPSDRYHYQIMQTAALEMRVRNAKAETAASVDPLMRDPFEALGITSVPRIGPGKSIKR
jgi:hypothetical protein